MSYVFDASALIALLRDEPGAEAVEKVLVDSALQNPPQCFAHSLNLCEVYYDFYRSGGEQAAQRVMKILMDARIVPREDLDSEFWQSAGTLKAVHKRVSLADCCAIALARRLDATILTSDHHEFDAIAAQSICRVTFIR